ncbi:hypothetical protein LZA78_08170 [Sinirhodobacter sp. WL0062]|uniref:Peptidase inhibitor I78 family protein n=1 Tax=Rhodobacter flavimaris TaxID=2907145 RepID=A0ABS8YUC3_9RHOB|nr:hypothetical protein [Sinirhodobacter sp. WL0062]MCE5973452.1 hypothetical protein [Sinirhodobacter sp. WL0062]
MLIRFTVMTAAALTLAACQSEPIEEAPPVMPAPYMTPAVTQTGGLEQREPDTCHAIDYVSALGQPGAIIPTLGITRPVNVIEWRGIEPQEYNPQRIVFRLDAVGNIFNIDCG